MRVFLLIFIFFSIFLSAPGFAMSFDGLWSKIRAEDPRLQENDYALQVIKLENDRANLSWLPKLGLEGRAFSSNDSGLNFSSLLAGREITTDDFSPTSLNHPGFHTFETASLGIDFAIYDGGQRSALSKALKSSLESSIDQNRVMRTDSYIESAKLYGTAISLTNALARLELLQRKIQAIIGRYRIGNKSNLVGYSGILGMKSLANRTATSIAEVNLSLSLAKDELSARSAQPNSWDIVSQPIASFIEQFIPNSGAVTDELTVKEKAAQSEALSASAKIAASRAAYLPKLGLFANEDFTDGGRDAATSFSAGVYLKWQLFDPDNINKVSEAVARENAKKSHFKATLVETEILRKANVQTELSIRKSLDLLNESETFLEEQFQVTQKLFQNGSVSALQMAEMLNRRVDLVLALQTTESKLIAVRVEQVKLLSLASQYE